MPSHYHETAMRFRIAHGTYLLTVLLNEHHTLHNDIQSFNSRLPFESSFRMSLESVKGSSNALAFLCMDDRGKKKAKVKNPGLRSCCKCCPLCGRR